MPNVLRLCAAGNTQWLAYASSDPDESYFCPAHQRALFEGFDPQPGQTVKSMVSRDHAEYVVRSREGDVVTLRPLGNPDAPEFTRHVANLKPHSEAFTAIYKAKGCGK